MLLPNSEPLVTPAQWTDPQLSVIFGAVGLYSVMQITRHSCICCLLRIHLANICLPIFLNSWGFIYKKKTHPRYNASLCHIPAMLFICVQLRPDFLLCYLLCVESSFSFHLELCGRRKIVLLNTDPN